MIQAEKETTFIKIFETHSLTDIAFVKSILDEEEIEYFLQGENMQFIQPIMDPVILMVAEKDVTKVVELLKPFKLNTSGFIFGHA